MSELPSHRTHTLWPTVAAIVALGMPLSACAALESFLDRSDPEVAIEPAQLPRQVRVGARGRLEPEGGIVRVSGPAGERIGELMVREGDWVRQGEAIAFLDSYNERLSERDVAASQLADARRQLSAET
ncbi:MAG: HlyD family secretion protein, partial [Cyanobacteria bacterium J06648_11]